MVHWHDPNAIMATLNLLYNVGSRDESPLRTGMAHLFEHLMFGGSANVESFDQAIEQAGGTNNAWTGTDFTNFYDTLPAVNLETAFWLESDRMLAPTLTPISVATQKSVVIEEFKQVCLNRPYGDMGHHLRALAFGNHPYSWPTIGLTPDHIEAVTVEDAQQFFYSHYAPNNAVLAVAGNVSPEQVRMLAEKWFGDIPARPIAPRLYEPAPPVSAPREKRVEADVPHTALTVAFPMGGRASDEAMDCDALTDLLALGRASRFFRNLVMREPLFIHADASILGSEEPGLLMLSARLASGSKDDINRAREMLIAEAMQAASMPPSENEMERIRAKFESDLTFSEMQPQSIAAALAMCEMQQIDPFRRIERYREVTPERIASTTRRIIDPDKAITLIYTPRKSGIK